jgi:hypothetical protein
VKRLPTRADGAHGTPDLFLPWTRKESDDVFVPPSVHLVR